MPNINVRKKIEKLSDEMDQLLQHVAQYSGISEKDAMFVDNTATALCEGAARLAAEARAVQGDRSADRLEKDVRRALGFTSP